MNSAPVAAGEVEQSGSCPVTSLSINSYRQLLRISLWREMREVSHSPSQTGNQLCGLFQTSIKTYDSDVRFKKKFFFNYWFRIIRIFFITQEAMCPSHILTQHWKLLGLTVEIFSLNLFSREKRSSLFALQIFMNYKQAKAVWAWTLMESLFYK